MLNTENGVGKCVGADKLASVLDVEKPSCMCAGVEERADILIWSCL